MRMRMRALLCRLRHVHNTGPQASFPSTSRGSPSVSNLASRLLPPGFDSSGNFAVVLSKIGGVRSMGIGSHKEGNRAGQHGVHYPNAKPDGSPEKDEADARSQFLEKAKAESAFNAAEAQEQKSGEAPTELQFGVKDGKSTNEAVKHASEELFKRTTIHGDESVD